MDKTYEIGGNIFPLPAAFQQDTIVNIDRFDQGLMLELERKELEIFIMDKQGTMKGVSQNFVKGTPTVRINKGNLLVYDRSNANFSLIANENIVTLDGQYSASEESILRLFFFKFTSQVCLAEQWKDNSYIKITFFTINLQGELIIPGKCYESQQRPQDLSVNVFKINEYGSVAWATLFSSELSLHTYNERQGYKQYIIPLGKLCPIFGQYRFNLLQVWTRNNLLFMVVSTVQENISSSYSQYSPILFFSMEDPQPQPKFIDWIMDQQAKQLIAAYSIEDYCILVGRKTEQRYNHVFSFSKDSQTIVLINNKFVGAIFKSYHNNTIITLNSLENEISPIKYMRQSSLPTRRLLEVLQESQLLQRTIKSAILIFGSEKSGKSTLRYFLSGQRLTLKLNEQLGYNQLISQSRAIKGEQDWQHHACALSVAREEVAIIEIPDWTEGRGIIKVELQVLMTRLFRIFQELHFVVTIPVEEMDDSYKTDTFFSQLFTLITSGVEESRVSEESDGIQNFMSIILTRVDSGSQSIQMFRERIEEIKDINSYTGSKLELISSNERILSFENREVSQEQGLQLLQTLLQFDREHALQKKGLFVEKYLENRVEELMEITSESKDVYSTMSAYLLWIGHAINKNVLEFAADYVQSYQPLVNFDRINIEENKNKVASLFLDILRELKKIAGDKFAPQFSDLDRLRDGFMSIAEQIFTNSQEKTVFTHQILSFCALLRFRVKDNQLRFSEFTNIFNNSIQSIFSPIILPQIISSFSQLKTITELQGFKTFQKLVPKSRGKTKKIIKKQMSYQQERDSLLRAKSSLLQKTCLLPPNALKLDLLLHQLSQISKKPALTDEDYRHAAFFIRQSSRICQYHSQYQQSLILLSIIPDFNGIEQLLDEYVLHMKKNAPYDTKRYVSSKQQADIIKNLLAIGQVYIRQNLVNKLINIINLSSQLVNKTEKVKSQIAQNYKSLSNKDKIKQYKERLHQQKPDLRFYDFKDVYFIKMMDRRQDLIDKCIQFENSEESKKKYENRESFRYLLDCMPISAM